MKRLTILLALILLAAPAWGQVIEMDSVVVTLTNTETENVSIPFWSKYKSNRIGPSSSAIDPPDAVHVWGPSSLWIKMDNTSGAKDGLACKVYELDRHGQTAKNGYYEPWTGNLDWTADDGVWNKYTLSGKLDPCFGVKVVLTQTATAVNTATVKLIQAGSSQ